MIEILLVFILVALIVSIFLLVYLLLKIREVRLKDVETSVSNAVSTTWIKLGLGDKISAVENHARDISLTLSH